MTAYEQATSIINILRQYLPESILKASYIEGINEETGQLIVTLDFEEKPITKSTIIEQFYFDFINGSEYQNIKPIHYSETTQKEFEDFIETLNGDREVKGEILDRAGAMCAGSEANGFVMGFKFAMKLFIECK